MFKLSDITHYLIADIGKNVVEMISNINIPDNTIDIADVIVFDNAATIINDLIQSKYKLVDTKEPFRNELLRRNLHTVNSPAIFTDVKEAPYEPEKIKRFIQELNEDDIYNCCNSKLYPQIALTQLARPNVKWTFSGDSWNEYGNYIANKLYYRNGSPKLAIFIETIKNSDRLFIVMSRITMKLKLTILTHLGLTAPDLTLMIAMKRSIYPMSLSLVPKK